VTDYPDREFDGPEDGELVSAAGARLSRALREAYALPSGADQRAILTGWVGASRDEVVAAYAELRGRACDPFLLICYHRSREAAVEQWRSAGW
jgi:hypothetical protein